MSGLSLSSTSTYSRSLWILLMGMDLLAGSISLYLLDLPLDTTLYIAMLLWLSSAFLTQTYNGRNYGHLQSITYHHLLALLSHAAAYFVLGIVFPQSVLYTPLHILALVLFWPIALSFKYVLFFIYVTLRNNSMYNKRYIIIGHSRQAYALRKFLKRQHQHGDLYPYAGTMAEPRSEADLQQIASYCIINNVHTLYYAGAEDNPFAQPLYELANQHYMYFHYVLAHNESTHYRWRWREEHEALAMLTCSPRKDIRWKHKKPANQPKLNIYSSP